VHLIRRLRGNIVDASRDEWLQEIWEPNAIWMAFIGQLCALEASPLTAVSQRLNAFDF
jgi:hypothetical protein